VKYGDHMNRIYNFRSKCPKLETLHSITIEYAEVNVCGDSKTYYTKLSYSCNEGYDCTFKDKYGSCPIYKIAPNNPQ